MSPVWLVVLGLCLGTVAIKAAGPLAVGGRKLPERARGVISLVAPALVAALVVYETFTPEDGVGVVVDARIVGLGAAVLALWARLPVLAVVVVAAAATALTRWLW